MELMTIINNVLYLCGLRHFWIEPEMFSPEFIKRYNVVSVILHFTNCCYSILLLSAFLTQRNLTTKQEADIVFNLANPLSYFYCLIFIYHKKQVREILYKLMVVLKVDQNDEVVENEMLTKLKLYVAAFLGSAIWTLLFYAAYGVYQNVLNGMTFITIITGWPDVREVSIKADIARVIFYAYWWISFLRISGSYILLLSLLIGLSKQFKNLQCFFDDMNKIFCENLTQVDKEVKYEKTFVRGIQMHAETIWCSTRIKHVCRIIFDAQMMLTFISFVTMLPVFMNPDRDPSSALANLPTALLGLLVTGFFMWNAGDISVEKPVTFTALGAIELSYNGYLRIIKASHSVFSVFY